MYGIRSIGNQYTASGPCGPSMMSILVSNISDRTLASMTSPTVPKAAIAPFFIAQMRSEYLAAKLISCKTAHIFRPNSLAARLRYSIICPSAMINSLPIIKSAVDVPAPLGLIKAVRPAFGDLDIQGTFSTGS